MKYLSLKYLIILSVFAISYPTLGSNSGGSQGGNGGGFVHSVFLKRLDSVSDFLTKTEEGIQLLNQYGANLEVLEATSRALQSDEGRLVTITNHILIDRFGNSVDAIAEKNRIVLFEPAWSDRIFNDENISFLVAKEFLRATGEYNSIAMDLSQQLNTDHYERQINQMNVISNKMNGLKKEPVLKGKECFRQRLEISAVCRVSEISSNRFHDVDVLLTNCKGREYARGTMNLHYRSDSRIPDGLTYETIYEERILPNDGKTKIKAKDLPSLRAALAAKINIIVSYRWEVRSSCDLEMWKNVGIIILPQTSTISSPAGAWNVKRARMRADELLEAAVALWERKRDSLLVKKRIPEKMGKSGYLRQKLDQILIQEEAPVVARQEPKKAPEIVEKLILNTKRQLEYLKRQLEQIFPHVETNYPNSTTYKAIVTTLLEQVNDSLELLEGDIRKESSQ